MSRYLLLLLLNMPFIIFGIVGAVTQYKLGRSSRRRLLGTIGVWAAILVALLVAQPLYEFLYSNELTQTEPLSLFDVMQITAIVVVFYIANRTRNKLESTERRLNDLHQELSIELSRNRPANTSVSRTKKS